MRIRIFNKAYHFEPTLTISLVTLCLLGLFLSLGAWQLQRSGSKQQLLSSFDARMAEQPVAIGANSHTPDQYQQISASGHYDNSKNILLDNKTHNGKVGYQVLTPFVVAGSNKLLLINRGFIPRGQSRQQLPSIPAISGQQTITGFAYKPLRRGLVLSENHVFEAGWPKRVQVIDFKKFSQLLQQPVYDYVLLLNPKAKHGFIRDWQPVVATSPHKHIGYASQWFLFALILLVLYIVLNFKREE